MSGCARAARWPLHARGVPFWVAVALGTIAAGWFGCLADPPTFAPRGQIPPFIVAGQVVPPLGAIQSIKERPPTLEVNVPFRSEDVNTALTATFYLDLVPGAGAVAAGSVLGFVPVAPSNYEEPRLVSTSFAIPRTGCHSVTLIMTYDDNIDELRNGLPIDEDRAARVVWWVNVGDEDRETLMADCPGASQTDPSGG